MISVELIRGRYSVIDTETGKTIAVKRKKEDADFLAREISNDL